MNCFIQHPLNADNFILDIPRMVNDACITLNQGNSLISIPLNEQQKDILQKAIDSFKTIDLKSDVMNKKFMEYWNNYKYLQKYRFGGIVCLVIFYYTSGSCFS